MQMSIIDIFVSLVCVNPVFAIVDKTPPDAFLYNKCTVSLCVEYLVACVRLLPLVELLRLCKLSVIQLSSLYPSIDIPAAVLFFFGVAFPRDLATFRCSSQSSSSSSKISFSGYRDRS